MVNIENHQDYLLLWVLNAAMAAIGMTDIDTVLKIILLIITIGYSIHKWVIMIKERNEKDDNHPGTGADFV